MPDLSPCPYCSGPAVLVAADLSGATWVVACHACEIEGPVRKSQGGAAIAWNWRPAEVAVLAEVVRLKELLDQVQRCAADRLAEISGDCTTYADAFRKLEIACGALQFLADA